MNKFKYLLLILSFILSFNSFQVAFAADDNDDESNYEEEYDDEASVKGSKDEDEDY